MPFLGWLFWSSTSGGESQSWGIRGISLMRTSFWLVTFSTKAKSSLKGPFRTLTHWCSYTGHSFCAMHVFITSVISLIGTILRPRWYTPLMPLINCSTWESLKASTKMAPPMLSLSKTCMTIMGLPSFNWLISLLVKRKTSYLSMPLSTLSRHNLES